MRRHEECSSRQSMAVIFGFVALCIVGLAVVVLSQWISTMVYYRVHPALLGPILRGLAVVLLVVGGQLLFIATTWDGTRQQVALGCMLALAAMLYGAARWPTSDATRSAEVLSSLMATTVILVIMWRLGLKRTMVRGLRFRRVIAVALILLALTLPIFVMSHFVIDITEDPLAVLRRMTPHLS